MSGDIFTPQKLCQMKNVTQELIFFHNLRCFKMFLWLYVGTATIKNKKDKTIGNVIQIFYYGEKMVN